MASIFTRIINGDIPGRILHEDDTCVVLLDIRPLHAGHALVVPKVEVDQWTDLDSDVVTHLMEVAHRVGRAQRSFIECERIGLLIAGFEVPHVHVHVIPLQSMGNLDFRNADTSARADALDAMAGQLSEAIASSSS